MSVSLKIDSALLTEKISEAIRRGEGLIAEPGNLEVLKPAYQTWDKRNQIMLQGAFDAPGFLTASPANDYTSAFGLKYPLGPDLAESVSVDGLLLDVQAKIQRLRSLLENLDAYPVAATEQTEHLTSRQQSIFIVHGRDLDARTEVELLVHRATSLAPVVLASHLNQGATLIEKLEKHLGGATFAIVLLTGDDLGRFGESDAQDQPGRDRMSSSNSGLLWVLWADLTWRSSTRMGWNCHPTSMALAITHSTATDDGKCRSWVSCRLRGSRSI